MKSRIFFSLLLVGIAAVSFTSCNKDCVAKENTNSGDIIEEQVVYPRVGYMTESMFGDYHISASSWMADDFQISSTGVTGKKDVDYNQYNILALPMKISCNTSFDREVRIDHTTGTVLYTVTATQCGSSCEEIRTVENYVVVPAFPDTYYVQYNPVIKTAK